MLALKMSPLEMCFSPKVLVMRADTVPFPEPGGPIMTARKILCRAISAPLRVHAELFRSGLAVSFPWKPLCGCAAETWIGAGLFFPRRSAQRRQEWARLARPASLDLDFHSSYSPRRCRNTRKSRRKRRRRKKMRSATSTVPAGADGDALLRGRPPSKTSPFHCALTNFLPDVTAICG